MAAPPSSSSFPPSLRLRRRWASVCLAACAALSRPAATESFQAGRPSATAAAAAGVAAPTAFAKRASSLASSSSAEAPTTSSSSSSSSSSSTGTKWTPKISSLEERRTLRNRSHSSERIGSLGFHHVEFYCGDAKSTALRFSLALGMPVTCVTGQGTGNDKCVSYGLQSGDVRFLFTAPYAESVVTSGAGGEGGGDAQFDAPDPLPSFDNAAAHDFFRRHGLAARAVGVEVRDARAAFEAAMAGGARPVLEPTTVPACDGIRKGGSDADAAGGCDMAEVELYGDVVLRFVSFPGGKDGEDAAASSSSLAEGDSLPAPFLPHLAPHPSKRTTSTYGLRRIDHAVGNVPDLLEAATAVRAFTGFHEFAEFTAEDVGTVESGLNSVVLASDSEDVLLPLNEPTEGRRKSQIQTYLEQNQGPGLQHLALKTDDIFSTISEMRRAEEELGGFELMVRPSDEYYRTLPDRLGDQLTEDQYRKLEELGILADADDEGVLLQVFTKPVGDRPTFFVEIIQRIGCLYKPEGEDSEEVRERPGCGGFGQGNFRELFKAIEDHEKTLKV